MATDRPRAHSWKRRASLLCAIVLITTGCSGGESTTSTGPPWTEENVTFDFGSDELFGVVTLPSSDGPHPAVVLVAGAASTDTGVRDGVASRALINYAHAIAQDGYAVLRYDPPGVGQSTGEYGTEILDERAAEAMAALNHLQARNDIDADRVGLWGGSQGSWVIAEAAAEHPDYVAFLITVSGAGISVAEQQVWGVETQTAAAGLSDEDVAKAGLMGRLLVDWQLTEPIYRDATEPLLVELGPGPWETFAEIVYGAGDSLSRQAIDDATGVLEAVQGEPWAGALYLKELYLPRLRGVTPAQVAEMRDAVAATLLTDPKDSLTRVTCPVLAFFGENDIVQPTERSAALFKEYLTAAGNDDFSIIVMPGVGHDINWTTPGYNEAVSEWLAGLA